MNRGRVVYIHVSGRERDSVYMGDKDTCRELWVHILMSHTDFFEHCDCFRDLLHDLEKCNADPVAIAECFVSKVKMVASLHPVFPTVSLIVHLSVSSGGKKLNLYIYVASYFSAIFDEKDTFPLDIFEHDLI